MQADNKLSGTRTKIEERTAILLLLADCLLAIHYQTCGASSHSAVYWDKRTGVVRREVLLAVSKLSVPSVFGFV